MHIFSFQRIWKFQRKKTYPRINWLRSHKLKLVIDQCRQPIAHTQFYAHTPLVERGERTHPHQDCSSGTLYQRLSGQLIFPVRCPIAASTTSHHHFVCSPCQMWT